MSRLAVGQIRYDLFQINETAEPGLNVDAYLLMGRNKAILIDTLQESEALYDTVKRLTDLPLEVIITHGHPDHAGRGLRQFHEAGVPVYMHEADLPLYQNMFGGEFPGEWFTEINEKDVFDLGGITLETILCKGHTPGSIVLFDEQNRRLFTGDAVGSGMFWMQIEGCTPLHEFRQELFRLTKRFGNMENLKIYPGHRWQSPVQLNAQYLKDTLALTDQILNHTDNGRECVMEFAGKPLAYKEASYGMMSAYSYNPENL